MTETASRTDKKRVFIVGGGLAGMTAAKALAEKGLSVVLLEAEPRLGGKAGLDVESGERFREQLPTEHGYHIFPPWYPNTHRLLRQLGVDKDLIAIDKVRFLRGRSADGEGPASRWITLHAPRNSLSGFLLATAKNLFSGLASVPEMILTLYHALWFANSRLSYDNWKDDTTVTGRLRESPLSTESHAKLLHHIALQGSSIAGYELSALSLRAVSRQALQEPKPIAYILNGNMYEKFIQPYERHLESLGVDIRLNCRVSELVLKELPDRVLVDGIGLPTGEETAEDGFVLATPHAIAHSFVTDEVLRAEERSSTWAAERAAKRFDKIPISLGDLVKLESRPMSAFFLPFKKDILVDGAPLPSDHVFLYESDSMTSFIDVSQHWKDSGRPQFSHTTLSVIAADFDPLASNTGDALQWIVEELGRYLPITLDDVDEKPGVLPNLEPADRLFLNRAGSWQHRPCGRTRLENLYVTGDYCKTEVDLTTMESAVMSGLNTARMILEDLGVDSDVGYQKLETYAWLRWRLAQLAFFPLALASYCLLRLGLVGRSSRAIDP